MKFKTVLEVLAGHASIAAILVLVLLLSLAGLPALQQNKVAAEHLGADFAISKADAVAEALLAQDSTGPIDTEGHSFTAQHYRGVLASNADTAQSQRIAGDAFAEKSLQALQANPQQPQHTFIAVEGQYHLRYAVSDRAGGMLMLDLPLDRERATVGRFFGQSFIASNALGFLLVALLLVGSFGLRFYLRGLLRLPSQERRSVIEAALRDEDPRQRRNLLPWMVALCALVFAFDLTNKLDAAVGIGYVLAVTLCLSSNRTWHITMVALLGAALLFIAPIFSTYDSHWWSYLERQSVSVFALLVTGLYGSAHMRKSRAEAVALAEAGRSRLETEELRAALQRAETAETGRRETADRLALANQAAGISMWEWDSRTDVVRFGTENRLIQERLGVTDEFAGLPYMNTFVLPEDRPAYENAFRNAFAAPAGGDDRIAHRYRIRNVAGAIQHIQFHGRVLRDDANRPVTILGVDWEVTREEDAIREIARQAAQLREAQERFQRAIRGTQDILFEIDVRSSRCWASPRFYELVGYAQGEVPETVESLYSIVHPEDRDRLTQVTDNHFRRGEPFDIEYRLMPRGREPVWVRSRASAQRDSQGRPTLLSGSMNDITEARAAREALVRAGRGSRSGEPRQEHVPRDHESRNPHADERRDRHDGAAAGDRPGSRATRLCGDDPHQRRFAADHPQRHPGFLQDRSRQAGYRRPGAST